MPSPIGHALAGVAVAWAADLVPGDRAWRTAPRTASWYAKAGNGLTLACVCLAVLPDVDLVMLPFKPETHRTVTHSVGAALVVALAAAAVARRARRPVARVSLMCAAAYATHLLLDWLGADQFPPFGLQMFWPFSDGWFISGWDVFRQTARRQLLSPAIIKLNALAIAQETAMFVPILVALWLVRVKALAGLATELARRDHAAQ
jgi:inner membrane protein